MRGVYRKVKNVSEYKPVHFPKKETKEISTNNQQDATL
jgi:hypothetical protein